LPVPSGKHHLMSGLLIAEFTANVLTHAYSAVIIIF